MLISALDTPLAGAGTAPATRPGRARPPRATRACAPRSGPDRAASSRAIGPAPSIAIAAALAAALLGGCAASAGGPTSAGPVSTAVEATWPLPTWATGIALSPDGTRAWLAAGSKILSIDTATGAAGPTIDTGGMPYALAIASDGATGVAADLMQQQAWVLRLGAQPGSQRLWVGTPSSPVLRPGAAIAPDGTRAFTTTSHPTMGNGFDQLHVVDIAAASQRGRNLPFHPGSLAVSADGTLLHVAGCTGICSYGELHTLDATSGEEASPAITLQSSIPGQLALSPDGRTAWVANALAGTVAALDLVGRSVLATVAVGAEPLGVAVSPDGTRVYVTCFQSGTLVAIDTASRSVVARARVGGEPRALAIAPDGRTAWLTHSRPILTKIDLTQLGA